MSRVTWFIAWFSASMVDLVAAWDDAVFDEVVSVLYDVVSELGDTFYAVAIDRDTVEVRTSLGSVWVNREKGVWLYNGNWVTVLDEELYDRVGDAVVESLQQAFLSVLKASVREYDEVEVLS